MFLWKISKVQRSRRNSGLTLIEIIVTLAILTILATLSLPRFKEFIENAALKNAAIAFKMDLMLAKVKAIEKSRKCGLKIVEDYKWIVFCDFNGDDSYTSDNELIKEVSLLRDYKNTTFSDCNREIFLFNNRGLPEDFNNGSCQICKNNKCCTVKISSLGRIKIES